MSTTVVASEDVDAGEPSRALSTREYRLLLYGPFTVLVLLSFLNTSDDPLITLRYAVNFAHGHGPVFNISQRVEGFSSPLHLAILTALQVLPWGHQLLKAKLVSLVFGVLAVRVSGRLFQEFEIPNWAMRLLLVAGGASFMMVLDASNGLETSLMCWLVTSFVLRLIRSPHGESPWKTGIIAAGVSVVRPEGAFIVVIAAIAEWFTAPKGSRRSAIKFLIVPAVALIALFLARHAYYGQWLPNTFYAKSPTAARALWWGFLYLRQAFQISASFLPREFDFFTPFAIVLLAFQLVLFFAGFAWKRDRKFIIASAVIVAEVAIVLRSGGDWMKGARFMAPVAPELVLLQVLGLLVLFRKYSKTALDRIQVWESYLPAFACTFLVLACTAPLLSQRDAAWNSHGHFGDQSIIGNGGYGHLSTAWLASPKLVSCAKPGDTVAYSEMGYFGLHDMDLNIIDVRGLTDTYIAHNAPKITRTQSGVNDLDSWKPDSVVGRYLIQQKPALILTFDFTPRESLYNGMYRLQDISVSSVFRGEPLTLYRRADFNCS
jgi:hypothetical protein